MRGEEIVARVFCIFFFLLLLFGEKKVLEDRKRIWVFLKQSRLQRAGLTPFRPPRRFSLRPGPARFRFRPDSFFLYDFPIAIAK